MEVALETVEETVKAGADFELVVATAELAGVGSVEEEVLEADSDSLECSKPDSRTLWCSPLLAAPLTPGQNPMHLGKFGRCRSASGTFFQPLRLQSLRLHRSTAWSTQ